MSQTFHINEDLLEALDEYHERTMLMERHIIEKQDHDYECLETRVGDDLIYNVPIYDMGSRKYAAFCSLTEAVWKKENDAKGNGMYFLDHDIRTDFDYFCLFYWFRLCGSGINYKPKTDDNPSPFGTHGFGNFWIVDSITKNQNYDHVVWLQDLINIQKPFTDNKGYLLPQFSFKDVKGGHLKKFIIEHSLDLIRAIYEYVLKEQREIYQITDFGNAWLNQKGFKKQNFVLTAFAADLAEYYPQFVCPKSKVYAGTQATRCIKTIFPKKGKCSEFDYINEVLHFQSERYDLNPIDCEDSRNCDVIRYLKEYQSNHHIAKNGRPVKNNSVLKKRWGEEKYYDFVKGL